MLTDHFATITASTDESSDTQQFSEVFPAVISAELATNEQLPRRGLPVCLPDLKACKAMRILGTEAMGRSSEASPYLLASRALIMAFFKPHSGRMDVASTTDMNFACRSLWFAPLTSS